MTPPEQASTTLPIVPAAAPGGWLKLYRCLMAKPIWTETTPEQKVLLLCLLMKANYTEKTWVYRKEVYHLKPGQLITSVQSLVEMGGSGMTSRKTRTALELFQKLGFLTMETSNRNTLITITNWASYQAETPEVLSDATNKRQTDDKQTTNRLTTTKKLRSKEREEGVIVGKKKFKTGFHLTESRFEDYTNEQLEAILQKKREAHNARRWAERGGA